MTQVLTGQRGRSFWDAQRFVTGLKWVKAHHNTIRGQIKSEWRRDGATTILRVVLPVGITAKVMLPAENQVEIPDAKRASDEGGCKVYEIGSGEYTFVFRKQ